MINYDNAIISAVVPTSIVGFVFGVQGITLQLLGLIPVGLSFLPIPDWGFTTILTSYSAFVFFYNLFFIALHGRDVQKLDDPERNTGKRGCLSRSLIGYT